VCIANYISIAKDKHIGHRHTWNKFLPREARRGTRSRTCGRGAAKQDDELDLGAAFSWDTGSDPIVPGGMCNFMWALEVGTFFVPCEFGASDLACEYGRRKQRETRSHGRPTGFFTEQLDRRDRTSP